MSFIQRALSNLCGCVGGSVFDLLNNKHEKALICAYVHVYVCERMCVPAPLQCVFECGSVHLHNLCQQFPWVQF